MNKHFPPYTTKYISGVWIRLLTCVLLFLMLLSTVAQADSGPKPSVQVHFLHMDSPQPCYGTLLSENASTGPASAWDGISPYQHYAHGEAGKDIWSAFVSYEDPDGFYFLQEWWDCTETQQLNWTYYPPQTFKILLYFPETDSFAVSGICERYAFDSYFTVDMANIIPDSSTQQVPVLAVSKNYHYTWELISLICRIILTIALEIGVALLFGLRHRQMLHWIGIVNIITQVLLNVSLNIINYNLGSLAFVVYYILLEIVVFVVEAALYCARLPRLSKDTVTKKRAVLYALVANASSFVGGMLIANWIPRIF